MVDYIALGADVALAVVAFIGTYYAFLATRLFRGDLIMERVWRLATIAFTIVALFSVLDFIFTLENSPLVNLHLVRIASVFALAVFIFAIMTVVRWGRSPMESRTQQSRQYPPH